MPLPKPMWQRDENKEKNEMSHELTITDGKAEMAYVGETPWHGLGNNLEPGLPIEDWVVAAGMNWRIWRSQIRYETARDGSQPRIMKDRQVFFRSDNGNDLGIGSASFKLVQPREVLEFFRDLTANAGFQLETAGTLYGGRRFWALASTGMSESIADKRDLVKGYLLLSTSCDGSMATEGRYTNIRVVCRNTMFEALNQAAKFRVTHRSVFKADDAKRELGIDIAATRFQKSMDALRRLADTKASDHDMALQTVELFRPGSADLASEEITKALQSKHVARINQLAIDGGAIGSAFEGTKGTQWGWLNAVTQFVDHETPSRNVNNRVASAWFGSGERMKTRALELATSAANGTPEVSYLKFQAARGLI
jgi:phage/plasmid-like protein (TIGR03299 family)